MRFYAFILMFVLSLALGGCMGLGSGTDSGSESGSDPISTGPNYYYAEFSDVAIPNEMQPDKKDTFISYTGDGIKLGTQNFSGHVELPSLVTAMQGYMQRDGWSLRSVFRANKSAIMIFEQQKKICSMYFYEEIFINTGMLIFVSPKLADGVIENSVPSTMSSYSTPLTSTDSFSSSGSSSAASDGNITVYQAK